LALEESDEMTTVADASFLIGIALMDLMSVLEDVIGHLYVAPAVWQEVVAEGAGKPGAEQVGRAGFIERRPILNRARLEGLKSSLGPGEAETLILAEELGCNVVLIDDLAARKAADQAGLHPIGVLGFLLEAKRRRKIVEIKPLIDKLVTHGFRLGAALIQQVLQAAGESGQ
jgi:predicted nucleic acid-binding protein